MIIAIVTVLALALEPVLAIPPPDFGFPEAPNDTALAVAFPQPGGSNIFVEEAILFGIDIPAQVPNIGVRTGAYRSLAEYNGSYVVLMVDPDASYPDNPDKRFFLHWLQANLTQSTTQQGNDDIGRPLVNESTSVLPLAPYVRPAPPTNSSAHRYIVYAFEQPSNFTIPEQWSDVGTNRASFNLTNFISDTNLGTPAAANFFYVSNESSVLATFVGNPGTQYPGGDGTAVTSGDPYRPTAAGTMSETMSSTAGAAIFTGAGAILGAGLAGLAAIL